jgi:prevent-host-death family protein
MRSELPPSTNIISALVARTQFGQLMRQANQRNRRFIVDRRGTPQVVIMGIKDFLRTIAPEPEVLTIIGQDAKRKRVNRLTMRQIDREIHALRQEKRSRDAASKGRP